MFNSILKNEQNTEGNRLDMSIFTSSISFGYKQPKWNPLLSLSCEDLGEDKGLDLNYISDLETLVQEKLTALNVPVQNLEPTLCKGMEVGDDRCDLSFSTVVLAREIIYQEKIFGMKTSEKDTFISNETFNFCEVTSCMPETPMNNIDVRIREGGCNRLDYYDTPVLRLIGNVQKGDRSHSSSATGKAGMLGRRLLTPRTSARPLLQLASWIQDGCLNTIKSPEPKYLPSMMGGSGCPNLFDNPLNTYLYLLGYKSGTYARVYSSAIREAKNCVESLDLGIPSVPVLCQRLREKQEYLHATYAGSVMVPPKPAIHTSFGDPLPLYKAAGGTAFLQGAERRLLATRKVITRNDAEVESARSHRINSILFGTNTAPDQISLDRLEKRSKAKVYGYAFRANAAVKALLDREGNGQEVTKLIRDFGYKDPGSGQKTLKQHDVLWIASGGKGLAYTIEDLLKSSDMYIRSEVSLEESLRVPGIPLTPTLENKRVLVETKAKIGVWDTNDSLDAWADRLIDEMLMYRSIEIIPGTNELLNFLSKDREWVSDDSILMELAKERTKGKPIQTILLLSSDIKLGRAITHATGCYILCIHPEAIIMLFPEDDYSGTANYDIRMERLRVTCNLQGVVPNPASCLVDYGSLKSVSAGFGRVEEVFAKKASKIIEWSGYRTRAGRELSCTYKNVPDFFSIKGKLLSPNDTSRNVTFDFGHETNLETSSRRSKKMVSFVSRQTQRPNNSFLGFRNQEKSSSSNKKNYS